MTDPRSPMKLEPVSVEDLEKGVGILSSAYVKDPNDPAWADDAGVKDFKAVLEKYMRDGDTRDQGFVNGYNSAMAMDNSTSALLGL